MGERKRAVNCTLRQKKNRQDMTRQDFCWNEFINKDKKHGGHALEAEELLGSKYVPSLMH